MRSTRLVVDAGANRLPASPPSQRGGRPVNLHLHIDRVVVDGPLDLDRAQLEDRHHRGVGRSAGPGRCRRPPTRPPAGALMSTCGPAARPSPSQRPWPPLSCPEPTGEPSVGPAPIPPGDRRRQVGLGPWLASGNLSSPARTSAAPSRCPTPPAPRWSSSSACWTSAPCGCASTTAGRLGARPAETTGHLVLFAPGQWAPGTDEGRRLISHAGPRVPVPAAWAGSGVGAGGQGSAVPPGGDRPLEQRGHHAWPSSRSCCCATRWPTSG